MKYPTVAGFISPKSELHMSFFCADESPEGERLIKRFPRCGSQRCEKLLTTISQNQRLFQADTSTPVSMSGLMGLVVSNKKLKDKIRFKMSRKKKEESDESEEDTGPMAKLAGSDEVVEGPDPTREIAPAYLNAGVAPQTNDRLLLHVVGRVLFSACGGIRTIICPF